MRDADRINAGEARTGSWLREWTGPLTTELLLEPGRFGLGKVPMRLKPDAIARSVCGFCSTGCALEVHIKDGSAVHLTPSLDHPVNLGMASPSSRPFPGSPDNPRTP